MKTLILVVGGLIAVYIVMEFVTDIIREYWHYNILIKRMEERKERKEKRKEERRERKEKRKEKKAQ